MTIIIKFIFIALDLIYRIQYIYIYSIQLMKDTEMLGIAYENKAATWVGRFSIDS